MRRFLNSATDISDILKKKIDDILAGKPDNESLTVSSAINLLGIQLTGVLCQKIDFDPAYGGQPLPACEIEM